ncbi:MAG: DUF1287 domain-containing protein [Chloroflexota bacterium]|nr:DUF1287 domain-containing protein [Chloroflexota bacterium]
MTNTNISDLILETLSVLAMAACILTISQPQPAAAQTTPEPGPVSVSSAGELGNSQSSNPSLSANGRFVSFASKANNLVAYDTNAVADIFVHDRLSGETRRVSISSTGEQANAASEAPTISTDGRFVAFQSAAANLVPNGEQNRSDIYVHDRLTGITERVSVNDRGERGNADSTNPSISGDGRYVAFRSEAANLVLGDTNAVADVFIHDRLTGHTLRASVSSRGDVRNEGNAPSGECIALASSGGHTVVFSSQASTLAVSISPAARIYLFNRVLAQIEYLNLPPNDGSERTIIQLEISSQANTVAALIEEQGKYTIIAFDRPNHNQTQINLPQAAHIALSADGEYLAVLDVNANLIGCTLATEERQTLAEGNITGDIALSSSGGVVAYTQAIDGVSQIIVKEIEAQSVPNYTLSGRVTNAAGYALALVAIDDNGGNVAKTDRNGNFFINGNPPGKVVLTPSKEGFSFEPESISLDLSADVDDIHFQAYPEKILEEAQKDVGMPYNRERGDDGDFHGYEAGYCTDLILDAYSWGAGYEIQFALEQDFRAHPEHFYRWRDARDAHDMWRYFSYSGQMLPHAAAYQPGDIVFFDWSEDGEIDHVGIVSEITADDGPKKMYAATGVTNSNPGGLATELPWEAFHERTVRGHARWSGAYQAVIPQMPPDQILQISAASAGVSLRLIDSQGNPLSKSERSIPGGIFFTLGWEQNLSVFSPLDNGEQYSIEITLEGESTTPYQFTAQTIQNGLVTERVEFEGRESKKIPVWLSSDAEGNLILKIQLSQRKIYRSLSD